MSDKPQPSDGEAPAQGGVFGNLPDARPGTRSPRRKTGATAKASATKATAKPKRAPRRAAKPAPKSAAKPAAKPSPPKPPPSPPKATEPRRPVAQPQQPGGIADVAWAGIAVAAEAATIGVRLASRAIEAVRGNSERD